MRTMIDTIAADEAAELEAARVRYVELLEPADPDPADAAELRSLMAKLGKSAGQLRSDHNVVQQARRDEALIREGSGLDARRAAAWQAIVDHNAETDRIKAEREQQKRRLSNAHHELENLRSGADATYFTLAKLVAMHPELLKGRPRLDRP